MIAALFVRADSVYHSMAGVDAWDEARDARRWPGGCPVVAHPPCRAWGQLRAQAKPVEGERELALFAMAQVRRWGGVLEHPVHSTLWDTCGTPKVGRRDAWGGWTFAIAQSWWGHRAEKLTRLYVVGCEPGDMPETPLMLGDAPRVVTQSKTVGKVRILKGHPMWRPEITRSEREATPPALAAWLVELARRCEEVAAHA